MPKRSELPEEAVLALEHAYLNTTDRFDARNEFRDALCAAIDASNRIQLVPENEVGLSLTPHELAATVAHFDPYAHSVAADSARSKLITALEAPSE